MQIINGECLEQMKKMESNSVETIITDPPYGLSFMGKKRDYDVPSVEIRQEALRVLKPGGTALIFAGSRTQHRMAINVEDAGFILKDTIMWMYGSGFPKATDISKQLDKKAGKEQKSTYEPNYKNNDYGKGMGGGKTDMTTTPATPEAKLRNGRKSHGLKPAYEPILVCQKPNEGTYASNALKWGVSGLNIDGGRIGTEIRTTSFMSKNSEDAFNRDDNWKPKDGKTTVQGRFPANIILDEEAGRMLDEQSGVSVSKKGKPRGTVKKGMFANSEFNKVGLEHNDKGGASRFFKNIPLDSRMVYVAKASKKEKNAGCEGLEKKQLQGGGGGIGDYKDDVNSCSGEYGSEKAPAQNNHPTVKPIKLMEYLCTLTKTPTGGTVLDPFAGSGTTGVACKNTGRDFIGIEMDAEYIEIAKARIFATD